MVVSDESLLAVEERERGVQVREVMAVLAAWGSLVGVVVSSCRGVH
jgi:hypothetical protein